MVVNLYEKLDLTYVEAVSQLQHEELCCQNTQEAQKGAIAMEVAAKSKSNIAGQNDNKNETWTCFHYGIKGHIKKDCWKQKWELEKEKREKKKKKTQESQPEQPSSKASITLQLEDYENAVAVPNRQPKDIWLIDSRASNHIMSNW